MRARHASGRDFRTFIYPAYCRCPCVHGHFLGGLHCRDREFGFLREMLVAPVSRSRSLSGMPRRRDGFDLPGNRHSGPGRALAHVPYDPILILTVIGELPLSFTLTAFGVMMAARIKQIQAFMAPPRCVSRRCDLRPCPRPVTRNGWAVPAGVSPGIVAVMGVATARDGDRGVAAHRVRVQRRYPRIHKMTREKGRRRVATGANHPASLSSAFRRGPGTPAAVPRRGTRAPI